MARPPDIQGTDEVRQMLQQLFEVAAAKSLAVIDQPEAEPEMARFLQAVEQHPEHRDFIVRLFIESFQTKWPSWEFMQFCMHRLRWAEIQAFIKSKKTEDVQQHGSRSSTVWDSILEAFEDDWPYARFFDTFRQQ